LAFIEHLGSRSETIPRAKCQHFLLSSLLTSDHPQLPHIKNWTNSETLETLLDLFSDTLITLQLHFDNPFFLNSQTIKAIGRIKGLHTLMLFESPRLGCKSDSVVATDHPACFNHLIMEAHALETLKLFLPLSLRFEPDMMAGTPYAAITCLEADLSFLGQDIFLDICTALKLTLKLLTIDNFPDERDVQQLLPIYKTLRGSLEALSINDTRCLAPIRILRFAKLRTLVVRLCLKSITDLLTEDIQVALAPITIIAVDSPSCRDYTANFTVDMLSDLPQLKKIVFMRIRDGWGSPATIFRAACEARNIRCIYVDHAEASRIMVSLKYPDDIVNPFTKSFCGYDSSRIKNHHADLALSEYRTYDWQSA
jgi:hypothetical protein